MRYLGNLFVFTILAGCVFLWLFEIDGVQQLQVRRRSAGTSVVGNVKTMFASFPRAANALMPIDNSESSHAGRDDGFGYNALQGGNHATIRVGTFNLSEFSREKANNPSAMRVIIELMSQFDVLAVQEIDPSRRDLLPRLIKRLNVGGGQYDFIIGPRIGPTNHQQRLAVIYDQRTVVADRGQTYTVNDPSDRIAYEPLVVWLRTQGVDPSEAWTFSLANVYIDPDHPDTEAGLLSTLFASIRADGRGEDDVVLAGCLFFGDHELAALMPNDAGFALESTVSDVRLSQQTSNIIFDRARTTEFTGESGTIDFLRKYNLTIEQAQEISSHLPVWAEFDVLEDQNLY